MIPTPPPAWQGLPGSGSDSGEPMTMMQVPERSRASNDTARAISSRATTAPSSSAGVRIRPSKTEWEVNKPTIIRLYMDEDLSLKDVMHIMVTEHGMKGTTEKMFKQRLRKWGCRKNISLKHEDEETLRQLFQQDGVSLEQHGDYEGLISPPHHSHQHRHRPAQGRDIRLANGQITTVDRLATHLRRKHDYYGRRQSNALVVATPSNQQPLPPLPLQKLSNTLITKTIPDPLSFRISEAVLHQTRTFIISRFKDNEHGPKPLAADGPKLVVQWRSYSEWLAYCNRIGIALRRHRLDEALREMRQGPEGITGILRAISGENQIPNVLGMLFYFLITVTRQTSLPEDDKKQLFVVVRALVKYAAQACAQQGLPENIIRLLQSIWYVEDDKMLYDLSNKAWQMTCQTWGSSPGLSGPEVDVEETLEDHASSSSTKADDTTASWTNIFSSGNPSSPGAGPELLPRTDLVIASATSHLSRRAYAELLILHSSYLHSAIAAQERNPALDDRLISIFQLVARVSKDPSHLTSMYTQLILAHHYRGNWKAVSRMKPMLYWALQNAPNEYLKVWAVITVRGHVAKLFDMKEMEKADRMAEWLAEMERMQWENSPQVLTPPPDFPDGGEEEGELLQPPQHPTPP